MKAVSTAERDWTAKEKEIAKNIREQGGDVKCTIVNGRRVFATVWPKDADRLNLHTNADGAIKFHDAPAPARRPVQGVPAK